MGLFDRFRRNKRLETYFNNMDNSLVNANINQSVFENGIYIERQDQTHLDIAPKLDTVGNQMYKQVFNPQTRKMQNLGIWLVDYKTQGYLEACDTSPEIREIYLDEYIKPNWFTDRSNRDSNGDTLEEFLANVILRRDMLKQIVEQREGYVGGIRRDTNGQFIQYINSGIVNELKVERQTGIPSAIRHRNDIIRTAPNMQTSITMEK